MTYLYKGREKEYMAAWYQANKDRAKSVCAANRKRRMADYKDRIRQIKTAAACADCGGRFHYSAMDFDHVGDDKVTEVSKLVANGASWRRIEAEMQKCELVCASCHRVRTFTRQAVGV